MIEINLLPAELRLRARKSDKGPFPVKYLLYIFGLIVGALFCLHIALLMIIIVKQSQTALLNNKWKALEPQRRIFEQSRKSNEILSSDAKAIQQLLKQRVNWSEKINKLSLNLPSGVWFSEMSLNQKEFSLKGSAVSLEKEELSLINKFMANLKNDTSFFRDFNSLELASVQRRAIGGYDIIDFVLSGKLK